MSQPTTPEPSPEFAEPTDRSLLRRLRAGSADAATQLYLRYAQRLRQLTQAKLGSDLRIRFDGEDLVQSVFRTFFRRVDRNLYDVPEGEDLWRLFVVIALNKLRTAATHHRAAKRAVSATAQGDAFDAAVATAAATDPADLANLRLVVEELLAALPPQHRDMINLRIEGHEVAEIAQRTGRSKRSVERVLQAFRAHAEAVLLEGKP